MLCYVMLERKGTIKIDTFAVFWTYKLKGCNKVFSFFQKLTIMCFEIKITQCIVNINC